MRIVEALPPDSDQSSAPERPHLRLVETTPSGHDELLASANRILERFCLDNRFEELAVIMAHAGISVDEFVGEDHGYGIRVSFNPSGEPGAADRVEAGLYPDEDDRLDVIGAGYYDELGQWTSFEARAGDGQEPPLRVRAALSAVASWMHI